MRLLLFNLATDMDDPILGFTTGWICALAERLEFVDVVTMRAGRFHLPGNVQVHSVGKEKGYGEPRRIIEFYKILGRILRQERPNVCFSHMMPLFTVMAGPILRIMQIPIVTWYAHPKLTWMLRAAHQLSTRMVASVPNAYPHRRDKFMAIGLGIDTKLFSPEGGLYRVEPPMILCVGRLSPVKDHPTLIRAIWRLRQAGYRNFRVVVLGGPATARDSSYVVELCNQVKGLGLETNIHFESAVQMDKLPAWYRRAAVVVNMTPTGSGDKVVVEAMACGSLCLVANEGFSETLGRYADALTYNYGDSEQLAERLKWVLSLPETDRSQISAYLLDQVNSMHGLTRLAQTLVCVFDSVKKPRDVRGTTQPAKSS